MADLAVPTKKLFSELLGGNTMPSTSSYLTQQHLEKIVAEVWQLPGVFFRTIPEWHKTKRATLFPEHPKPNYPLGGRLGKFILPSTEKWTPEAMTFANDVAFHIGQAAQLQGQRLPDSLKQWRPNRLRFNLMEGTKLHPAHIPDHIDPPEEVGVVVALELIGKYAGQLSLIFGADTCQALGQPQPLHELISHEPRLSLTLAELTQAA